MLFEPIYKNENNNNEEEKYSNPEYKRVYDKKWNFKDGSMKELVHGLHPYPAMLMPLIVRTLLKSYGGGA